MARVHPPVALTIAGSDSGGGAGIQADLKTFAALGVHGTSALTAVTAQNTLGVTGVHMLPPAMVEAQIEAVLSDLDVRAAKTGMLGSAAVVEAVARALSRVPRLPLVVDPVMVATSGDPLIDDDAVRVVKERLLPLAALVTPNLPEAARLLGAPVATTDAEAQDQARRIKALGCAAVLVKGGHASGAEAVDWLFDGVTLTRIAAPRIETRNTHGTGCTLSAAIAAGLAKGASLGEAVQAAKHYLSAALSAGAEREIGKGHGPVHHMYVLDATAATV